MKKNTISTILHSILIIGIIMMMVGTGAIGDLIASLGIIGISIFYLVDEIRSLDSAPKFYKVVLILIPAVILIGQLIEFGRILLVLPLLFFYSFIKTKFSHA